MREDQWRTDVGSNTMPWRKTCFGCDQQFKFSLKNNPTHCPNCQDLILEAAIGYMERNDFNTAELIKKLEIGAKK